MKVAIYQLVEAESRRNAIFMQPEDVVLNYSKDYQCVYSFYSTQKLMDEESIERFLESIFIKYQDVKPKNYQGSSVSGTDIITVEGHGAYFCNKIVGWTKVCFRASQCGKLISLEGIDGCGKSSALKSIESTFCESEILILREPGSTKISEKIRELLLDPENQEMSPWCEAYLYAASRAQLVQEVIKPALDQNKIVIVDRFIDSSIIYQGICRRCGMEEIKKLNKKAMDSLKPDLTILFDCPAEIAFERRKNRNNDRIELEDLQFFKEVREGYLKLAKTNDHRFITIDATLSHQEINKEINRILNNLI